ncbi:hypothetical protein [Methylorubrum extorquens]|uniref:hypothetical protein n=2 Tax=Methylorubrum extorquens TaxID=408 RepID=UPI0022390D7E|nr:hypothetical protein [Methylorubrum extorquens]UYW33870.1 hypothetical protein OKB92_07270 [Methylorubrum extorquens]
MRRDSRKAVVRRTAMERALFEAYDVSAIATQAHIDLFRKGVGGPEDGERVAKVSSFMEYLPKMLAPYGSVCKRNLLLFLHRVAPEKQARIFDDLSGEFLEWETPDDSTRSDRAQEDVFDHLPRSAFQQRF